jgi:hypothetical protein
LSSPLIALEGDLTAPHLTVAAERGGLDRALARQASPEGTVVLNVQGLTVWLR